MAIAGVLGWFFFPLIMSGWQKWRTSPFVFFVNRIVFSVVVAFIAGVFMEPSRSVPLASEATNGSDRRTAPLEAEVRSSVSSKSVVEKTNAPARTESNDVQAPATALLPTRKSDDEVEKDVTASLPQPPKIDANPAVPVATVQKQQEPEAAVSKELQQEIVISDRCKELGGLKKELCIKRGEKTGLANFFCEQSTMTSYCSSPSKDPACPREQVVSE